MRELYQGPGTGDWQHVIWNGRTEQGTAAASGLYLIQLENGPGGSQPEGGPGPMTEPMTGGGWNFTPIWKDQSPRPG